MYSSKKEKVLGKNFLYRLVCSFLILVLVFTQSTISLAQASDVNTSETSPSKSRRSKKKPVPEKQAIDAEFAFYSGDFAQSASLFSAFAEAQDKDFALWNNQLGTIYLAEGDYNQALSAFLSAYYLMNDTAAFSNLESHATSLTGAEREKAYKGEPYERVYNSLYVALLLEKEHDYDNAIAAIKNGILCDSDVEGGLYKSDVSLLYLLGARLEALRNNQTMSREYFQKAQEAYLVSHPLNRGIVSDEQGKADLLGKKQEELEKLLSKQAARKSREEKQDADSDGPAQNFTSRESTKVSKESKKITELEAEIEAIEKVRGTLSSMRTENNKQIPTKILEQVIDTRNNVLFIIELGRSPVKYAIGKYGHIAIFASKPYKATSIAIVTDKKGRFGDDSIMRHHDTMHQASTRGGRVMDGILKGKAEFKETTAQISYGLSQVSQQMANQANQLQQQAAMYGTGGAAASGAGFAAAGIAVIALAIAISSAMANPAADVRHWSLLPAELRVLPMQLSPGLQHIQLQVLDENNTPIPEFSQEFDVNIQQGDNIIIKRILE